MSEKFYGEDHEGFRDVVRAFVARHVEPFVHEWDDRGDIDPTLWPRFGEQGFLGLGVPEDLGGGGTPDYRYRLILSEELARVGAASVNSGLSLFDDLVIPYILGGTRAQQELWLPRLCAGEASAALAITEPDAGSDIRGIQSTAVRHGDGWRLNGRKTFITNGLHADVVIVVARTESGLSLFLVERALDGFESGPPLDKLGQRGESTTELFLDDVIVGAESLLGEEGNGLGILKEHLPLERLSIAGFALSAAEAAYDWTRDHVRTRTAFGQRIADFQNTRMVMAEMRAELDLTRAWLERAVIALNGDDLSAQDAAQAKWWTTELQQRILARCLQLHGGYGYMREQRIARAFVDGRIQTVYGGATEVLKDGVGRALLR